MNLKPKKMSEPEQKNEQPKLTKPIKELFDSCISFISVTDFEV